MFFTGSHNSVRVVLYIAYIDDMFFVMYLQKGALNICIYLYLSFKQCRFGNLAMVKS